MPLVQYSIWSDEISYYGSCIIKQKTNNFELNLSITILSSWTIHFSYLQKDVNKGFRVLRHNIVKYKLDYPTYPTLSPVGEGEFGRNPMQFGDKVGLIQVVWDRN